MKLGNIIKWNLSGDQVKYLCRNCPAKNICSATAFLTCSTFRNMVHENAIKYNREYYYEGKALYMSGVNISGI